MLQRGEAKLTPKTPLLAVDAVIPLNDGSIILVKRKNPPFKGLWALPGGIVEYGETVEQAVIREVKEETGLKVKPVTLIGVYSDPDRDPRGHVVSICYKCVPLEGQLKAGSDAHEVASFSPSQLKKMKLAFDHNKILEDAGVF
ncbi:MAG: NUDIX domain-containing protein [Candidatus Odinarchaeia archaeon]